MADAPDPTLPLRRLLRAAWWAIGLGLAVQVLVLLGRFGAGATFPAFRWVADVAGGVTWAVVVCAGVALGSAFVKGRAAFMGVLGLFAAPLALALSKGAQRSVQRLLEAPVDRIGPLVYATAGVKGLEYAILGLLLARLLDKDRSLQSFVVTGAAVGAVACAVILTLNLTMGHPNAAQLTSIVINELFFPAGCAAVIRLVSQAGRQLKTLQPA